MFVGMVSLTTILVAKDTMETITLENSSIFRNIGENHITLIVSQG